MSVYLRVMPGLVPGTHASVREQGMDGRDKPGHEGVFSRIDLHPRANSLAIGAPCGDE
jgi:hypothetical protein